MTIEEAFRRYKEISIEFVFEIKCLQCGKIYQETDKEYSFEGDLEHFKEWCKEYSVMELDEEIEQIEGNRFKYKQFAPEGDFCENCLD